MLRLLLPLLLPLLLLATPAAAQQVDEQLWLQANADADIAKDLSVTLESIARFADKSGGIADSQFGAIVNYAPSKAIEIGLGYRHVQDYDHGRILPNEERLRQTISFTLAPGLSARTRFEQLFSSAGPGVALRLRQQIRYAHPIGGGLSAFVAHESFWLPNSVRQHSGYDRMRNSAGLLIPLGSKLRGEASYLNQYRFGRARARDRMDHVASFAITLSL